MRAGEMSELISRAKEIIEHVTPKSWKRDKARLLELQAAGSRDGVPRNGEW